jgi:2-oxoglutarate ferredoxin oxidoreductase subunit alpha
MDYTIRIGGEAGQGVQTVGDSLARVFARCGYHVFVHQEYESRIRGGHNFFQVRFSDRPVTASRSKIDILIALDRQSISEDGAQLAGSGIIVYDSSMLKEKYEGTRFLDVPFVQLATEGGGSTIMANTVATGAVLGMLGVDSGIFGEVIANLLAKKGEQIIEENRRAAGRGYEFAARNCSQCAFSVTPVSKPNMLIDSTSALGIGAIASGCKFYTAYPMTPTTGILTLMASKAEQYGIVVEQAEDEIAAINMALGASFAGVRSMTASAGGGFALMVEGLSLAAITETPIVIVVGGRPGPATGLPTRTEQADLLFVLHAAHGEFPRIIFAPGSAEQAFFLVNKAFDLSQKHQVPAFILTDQYLADTQWTYESFALESMAYTDYRLRGDAFKEASPYKRHAFTETGVSPFGVPGDSVSLVVTDSDEHDEEGHITEDAQLRRMMVEKRLFRKLPHITGEIAPPLQYGHARPEVVLIGWGSTYGVLREIVDTLSPGLPIAMLHFSEIYPFPKADGSGWFDLLKGAGRTICVEQNATSQFARLLKTETGFVCTSVINKYDGRPFLIETLLEELRGHLE